MPTDRGLELYIAVREAVNEKWDPIGVYPYSGDAGEYDSYLPKLCEILKKGATEDDVFEFLWIMETESMGLSGDKKVTRGFSKKLIELRNSLLS